jgi:hypothetical protein
MTKYKHALALYPYCGDEKAFNDSEYDGGKKRILETEFSLIFKTVATVLDSRLRGNDKLTICYYSVDGCHRQDGLRHCERPVLRSSSSATAEGGSEAILFLLAIEIATA